MPQSAAMSLTVILVSGFFSSKFLRDCSNARFVTCDIPVLLCQSEVLCIKKSTAFHENDGGFMAERAGFEPACDCSQTDFESAPL